MGEKGGGSPGDERRSEGNQLLDSVKESGKDAKI